MDNVSGIELRQSPCNMSYWNAKDRDWVLKLNWGLSFYHWITAVKNAWKNPWDCKFDYTSRMN